VKKILIYSVVMALVFLTPSAAGTEDGFEDQKLSPTWNDTSGNDVNFTIQSSNIHNGSYALELKSGNQGTSNWNEIVSSNITPSNVDEGEEFSIWWKNNGSDDMVYEISNSTSFPNGGSYFQVNHQGTDGDILGYDGSVKTIVGNPTKGWYKTILTVYTSNNTATVKAYNSSGKVGNTITLSTTDASALSYTHLGRKDADTDVEYGYADEVSFKALNESSSPPDVSLENPNDKSSFPALNKAFNFTAKCYSSGGCDKADLRFNRSLTGFKKIFDVAGKNQSGWSSQSGSITKVNNSRYCIAKRTRTPNGRGRAMNGWCNTTEDLGSWTKMWNVSKDEVGAASFEWSSLRVYNGSIYFYFSYTTSGSSEWDTEYVKDDTFNGIGTKLADNSTWVPVLNETGRDKDPFVFKANGSYYMAANSGSRDTVKLFKAPTPAFQSITLVTDQLYQKYLDQYPNAPPPNTGTIFSGSDKYYYVAHTRSDVDGEGDGDDTVLYYLTSDNLKNWTYRNRKLVYYDNSHGPRYFDYYSTSSNRFIMIQSWNRNGDEGNKDEAMYLWDYRLNDKGTTDNKSVNGVELRSQGQPLTYSSAYNFNRSGNAEVSRGFPYFNSPLNEWQTVNNTSSVVNNTVNNIFYDFSKWNLDQNYSFSWNVELFQSDGDSTTSGTRSFALQNTDTGFAGLTIHQPPNSTISDPTPWLNATAKETVDTWLYNLDSTGNTTFTPNKTFTGLADGQHNVTVWANDTNGNYGKNTRYFEVDTTAPGVNIDRPKNTTYKNADVLLNGTFSESSDGVYNLDGGTNTSLGNGISSFSTTVQDVSNGTHTFNVFSTDSSGNTGSSSVTFTVDNTTDDTTPPDSSDNWTYDTYQSLAEAKVELSATDSSSSVANVSAQIDSGGYSTTSGSSKTVTVSGDGNHTLEYYAFDSKGNKEQVQTEYILLDTETPTISSNATDGWKSKSSEAVKFTASDSYSGSDRVSYRVGGSGSWTTATGSSASTTVSTEANNTVEFNVTDKAGNTASIATDYVALDTTPPDTLLNNTIAGWTSQDGIALTISLDDELSTGYASSYRVDGGNRTTVTGANGVQSFDVSGDRNHTVEFNGTDEAGNQDTINTSYFAFDTVAPSAADIGSPLNQTYNQSTVDLNVSGSDSLSGIGTWHYGTDGDSTLSSFTPNTSLTFTKGQHSVEVVAEDLAGNMKSSEVSFYVNVSGPRGYIKSVPTEKAVSLRSSPSTNFSTFSNAEPGLQDVIFGNGLGTELAVQLQLNMSAENMSATHLAFDSNRSKQKAYVHNTSSVNHVNEKTLLIPRVDDTGKVHICPGTENFSATKMGCGNGYNITSGDTVNGVSLSEATINGDTYYEATGITGTGGLEVETSSSSSDSDDGGSTGGTSGGTSGSTDSTSDNDTSTNETYRWTAFKNRQITTVSPRETFRFDLELVNDGEQNVTVELSCTAEENSSVCSWISTIPTTVDLAAGGEHSERTIVIKGTVPEDVELESRFPLFEGKQYPFDIVAEDTNRTGDSARIGTGYIVEVNPAVDQAGDITGNTTVGKAIVPSLGIIMFFTLLAMAAAIIVDKLYDRRENHPYYWVAVGAFVFIIAALLI
jgi:hypothetical protein